MVENKKTLSELSGQFKNFEPLTTSTSSLALIEKLKQENSILREDNRALKQINDLVKKESRYKYNFLINLSHELRTPLNSILLLAQSMNENRLKNLNERQVKNLEIIYGSGRKLLNLIDEIIDLAKLETNRLTLNKSKIDLKQFISNLSKFSLPDFEKKGIGFSVNSTLVIPENFTTDSNRLYQVLKYLLANSLLSTETGQIRVNFNLLEVDNTQFLDVTISDTGKGLSKGIQTKIFEKFEEIDFNNDDIFEEIDIRLILAVKLTNLLSGKITVESEINTGTTYKILIPDY